MTRTNVHLNEKYWTDKDTNAEPLHNKEKNEKKLQMSKVKNFPTQLKENSSQYQSQDSSQLNKKEPKYTIEDDIKDNTAKQSQKYKIKKQIETNDNKNDQDVHYKR